MWASDPEVDRLFRRAGWMPNRRVDPDRWHNVLGREGYAMFPAAYRLVANVGDLTVDGPGRPFTNEYARQITFDPVEGGSGEYDRFEEWQGLIGQRLYPLADQNPRLAVMVAEDGAIYAGMMDLFYRWGDTFEQAMANYFLGLACPLEWPWGAQQ